MNDATWSGFIVLRGAGDLSPVFTPAIEGQPGPVELVYGNTKVGEFQSKSVTTADLTLLKEDLKAKPYLTAMFGPPKESNHIYVRSTTIRLWGHGAVIGGFAKLIDSIVNLNKNRKSMDASDNYATHIAKYVVSSVQGKYAASIAYLARQTSILLVSHGIELYCWVLSVNKTSLFIWSTDPKYVSYILSETTVEADSHTICWPIEMGKPGETSVVAIHPVFWVTKFHRALTRTPNDYARVLLYFKSMVERLSVVIGSAPLLEVNSDKGESNDKT